MRMAKSSKDLVNAWELARKESKLAFDNDDMYIEKFIENPRSTSKQYLLMSSVVISPDSDFIPLNKECCWNIRCSV